MNGRVSHCFPLNGKSRDPYCQGIDGVVNAYYDSLAHGKVIKGAFNNYVDQVLPNSDPAPPLRWTIVDILQNTYTLFHLTNRGLSTEHLPTSDCPRSY